MSQPWFLQEAFRRLLPHLPTPCYVVSHGGLRHNLELLASLQEAADCHILLALKGYALWSTFPLIARYLAGAAVSSRYEGWLAAEAFEGRIHSYFPAFKEEELEDIAAFSSHLVFNSPNQWHRFARHEALRGKSLGLRLNPQLSQVAQPLYDACRPRSRLGVVAEEFARHDWSGLEGIHVHALCESDWPSLARLIDQVLDRFGSHLKSLKWLNLGGGHLLTRHDYDRASLVARLRQIRQEYGVKLYLEPSTAVVFNAGVMVTRVLDISWNQGWQAMVDTSPAAHLPDILEMPYRAEILGAAEPGVLPHSYQLGGVSCLAGDILGDYSFAQPLQVGDRLVLLDMAPYTQVKNTLFNGLPLPTTVMLDEAFHPTLTGHTFQAYKERLAG